MKKKLLIVLSLCVFLLSAVACSRRPGKEDSKTSEHETETETDVVETEEDPTDEKVTEEDTGNKGTTEEDTTPEVADPVYKVKIADGTPKILTVNPDNSNEVIIIGVKLEETQQLTFTKDGTDLPVTAEADKEEIKNNVSNELKVLCSVNAAKITLNKTTNKVWVTGYVAPDPVEKEFTVTIGDKVVKLTNNTEIDTETLNAEYFALGLNLKAGTELVFSYGDEILSNVVYEKDEHNNVNAELKVITDVIDGKLYFKQYKDKPENWVVYLTGNETTPDPEPTEPVYTITIGEGEGQKLVINPENNKEYMLTNVDLTKGQKLVFTKDGKGLTVTAKENGKEKNNLAEDLTVLNDAEKATISLNIETNKVWVTGYVEPKPVEKDYTVTIGEIVVKLTKNTEINNKLNAEYFALGLNLKAGDELVFKYGEEILSNVVYEKDEHNNVNAELKVVKDVTDGKLYFKQYEDKPENWVVYLTGNEATPDPEPVYTITIGEGEGQKLVINPENNKEYMLTNVDLTKGQKLVFTKDGKGLTVTAKENGKEKNNLSGELTILNDAEKATISLNIETNKVWVTGYVEPKPVEDVYTLTIENNEPIQLIKNEKPMTGIALEYMTDSQKKLSFEKGAKITFKVNGKEITVVVSKGKDNRVSMNDKVLEINEKITEASVYLQQKDNSDVFEVFVAGTVVTPEPVYTITIGDGKAQNLVVNPSNNKEYILVGVNLTEGQKLSFTKDGKALTVTAKENGDNKNNLSSDLTVLNKAEHVTISLNIETNKVWVTGYVEPKPVEKDYTVTIGEIVVKLTKNTEINNKLNAEYFALGLNLKAGDELVFKYGDEILSNVVYEKDEHNNVNSELKVVKAVTDGKLYFKQYEDKPENWVVYLTGNEAEKQTATIYYLNTLGWKEVYAYAKVGQQELLGAVPGTKLEATQTENLFKVSVSAENLNGLTMVFSNKESVTPNLVVSNITGDTYYYGNCSTAFGTLEQLQDAINPTFVLKIDGANPVDLVKQSEGVYKATGVDLEANQVLTVEKNAEGYSILAKKDEQNPNNVKKTEAGIVVINKVVGAEVILDTNQGEIWVSGYVKPAPKDPVYTLTIGEGQAQTLVINKENNKEYMLAGVQLTKGQKLVFAKDSEALTVTAKENGTDKNNLAEDLTILNDVESATICLDIETNKVWVTGYVEPKPAEATYQLSINGQKPSTLIKNEGAENEEYMLVGVQLKAGDSIAITKDGTTIEYTTGNGSNMDGNKVHTSNPDAAIYLKIYNDKNELYVTGRDVQFYVKYNNQYYPMVKSTDTEAKLEGLAVTEGSKLEIVNNDGSKHDKAVAKGDKGNGLNAEMNFTISGNVDIYFSFANENWGIWVNKHKASQEFKIWINDWCSNDYAKLYVHYRTSNGSEGWMQLKLITDNGSFGDYYEGTVMIDETDSIKEFKLVRFKSYVTNPDFNGENIHNQTSEYIKYESGEIKKYF